MTYSSSAARPGEQDSVLTLAEAADRLGVHYMTAYRYVQLGRLEATKVGKSWAVSEDAITAFQAGPNDDALPTDEAIDALIEAIVAGEEEEAWNVIDPIVRTTTPDAALTDVIGPAMDRIGQQWVDGQRSIADEHRASAVTRRLLGRVRPSFRAPGRRRGVVVVAAPTGDHHSIPVSMFADLVRSNGCDVIDLGAETPLETLLEVANRHDGRLVICLTITHPLGRTAASHSIAALREQYPDIPVFVGGRAIVSTDDALALGSSALDSNDPATAAASVAHLSATLAD